MGDGLFISTLQTDPRYFFAVIITVVISITLHELAHGWVAITCGDESPIYNGHMTMNPLVHMGGFSILMLFIAGIAWGAMPIDPTRLRGKYAEALVAVAGPVTNIILAFLTLTGLGLWLRFGSMSFSGDDMTQASENARYLLLVFGSMNLMLAIFNILPVPPLDGSHILGNFVPAYRRWLGQASGQGIMTALFFVLFIGAGRYISEAAFWITGNYLSILAGN